jgi:hypothetical protein
MNVVAAGDAPGYPNPPLKAVVTVIVAIVLLPVVVILPLLHLSAFSLHQPAVFDSTGKAAVSLNV